jgi:5-(hydroxymethyl)furfural/furfural oxidase
MRETYDVIVVGAGSAGCIVARRLSADPACQVLLLEAGSDPGPAETAEIRHPYPLSAYDASLQWPGLSGQVVGATADQSARRARVPQGRVVGGSSAINAMVALRGVAADYDEWHAQGASGWAWRDVRPWFERLESADPEGACDDTGAIAITRQPPSPHRHLSNALLDTWAEAGLPQVQDPNTEFRDGSFVQPVSTDAGGRCSANRAWLGARTRARRNLTVAPGTTCLRVLIDAGRVTGVEVATADGVRRLRAGHVVLCAGALQSPAILLRSGVGDPRALQALGIAVQAALPAVGRNLQNHGAVPLGVALRSTLPGAGALPAGLPTAHAALRLSSGRHPSGGDTYMTVWDRAAWHAAGGRIAVLNVVLHRPLSCGSVTLRTADPAVAPVVDFHMLDAASDVERLGAAVQAAAGFLQSRAVREVAADTGLVQLGAAAAWMGLRTPATRAVSGVLGLALRAAPGALRPLQGLALKPLPAAFATKPAQGDAMRRALRSALVLQYHQVGTCAMGAAGTGAVTSPEGCVHGVAGLMVADASILPAVPRANTNLPVMMAAERVSAMFLKRQAPSGAAFTRSCPHPEETSC